MPSIKITFDEREFVRKLQIWGKSGIDVRMEKAAREAGTIVENYAAAEAPVGTGDHGHLKDGHVTEIIRDQKGRPAALVRNTKKHAIFVHAGRRIGAKIPPPGALVSWMDFRGMDKRDPPTSDFPWYWGEFLLGKSISRKGIKPNPWMRRAMKRAKTKIINQYVMAFSK